MKHPLKYIAFCLVAGFVLTGTAASAQTLTLIGQATNDGGFESITGKFDFTSPTSSTNTIPYWGATLVNAAGGTVGAPSDSGAQVGGNVVQSGQSGAFFQPNGSSTAFNLVTTRTVASGDRYTLTWYAFGAGDGTGSQVATLFTQAPATVGTTYAYTPLATVATFTSVLTGGFVQYSLTYTAKAADVGSYIGLTYGNSSPGSYSVADSFSLTVVPEPSTYFLLVTGAAVLVLTRRFRTVRS